MILPFSGAIAALAAACCISVASASETVLYQEDFSGAIANQGMEPGNPAGWRAGPPAGTGSTAEPWFIRSDGEDNQYLEFAGANIFDGAGRANATRQVPAVLTDPGAGWRVVSDFKFDALSFGEGDNALRVGVTGAAERVLYLSSSLGGGGQQ